MPAEHLAELIFREGVYFKDKDRVDLRIIDFGCGRDGLFEKRLSDKAAARDGHGKITVVAVDAQLLSCANELNRVNDQTSLAAVDGRPAQFECIAKVQNYAQDHDYGAKFDVAVFCLSFMAQDALAQGLLAAAKMEMPHPEVSGLCSISRNLACACV